MCDKVLKKQIDVLKDVGERFESIKIDYGDINTIENDFEQFQSTMQELEEFCIMLYNEEQNELNSKVELDEIRGIIKEKINEMVNNLKGRINELLVMVILETGKYPNLLRFLKGELSDMSGQESEDDTSERKSDTELKPGSLPASSLSKSNLSSQTELQNRFEMLSKLMQQLNDA